MHRGGKTRAHDGNNKGVIRADVPAQLINIPGDEGVIEHMCLSADNDRSRRPNSPPQKLKLSTTFATPLTKQVDDSEGGQHEFDGGKADEGYGQRAHVRLTWR